MLTGHNQNKIFLGKFSFKFNVFCDELNLCSEYPVLNNNKHKKNLTLRIDSDSDIY